MAKTITADRGAITLNTSTPGYNPLSIVSGVTVSAGSGATVYGDNSLAWTITNAGTISSAFGVGVELAGGGTVTNSGRVTAAVVGVLLKGSPAQVDNQGSMTGGSDGGDPRGRRAPCSTVPAPPLVSGGLNGVYVSGGVAIVDNTGTMTGTGTNSNGVYLMAGGNVSNSSGARISGGKWGVFLTGSTAGTVSNAGTISGATGAVHFGNANGNQFYLSPGAVTNGAVKGGTGTDTLVLQPGAGFGDISGIGSQFTGFEELDVQDKWLVTGGNTVTAAMLLELQVHGDILKVAWHIDRAHQPGHCRLSGTLAAGVGGRIEVGGAGTARAGQIVIDAGHTLTETGNTDVLVAPVVINRGTVTGVVGLDLVGASSVTNSGTASLIFGSTNGMYSPGGQVTVFNQGSIGGGASAGVTLANGGTVINSGTAARITGQDGAVKFELGQASLLNQGTLAASDSSTVYLRGGVVTNAGTAADIVGANYGVFAVNKPATITNQGSISCGRHRRVVAEWRGGGQCGNGGDNRGCAIDGVFSRASGAVLVTNQGSISGGFFRRVVFQRRHGLPITQHRGRHRRRKLWCPWLDGQPITVTNQGTIAGEAIDGVCLKRRRHGDQHRRRRQHHRRPLRRSVVAGRARHHHERGSHNRHGRRWGVAHGGRQRGEQRRRRGDRRRELGRRRLWRRPRSATRAASPAPPR